MKHISLTTMLVFVGFISLVVCNGNQDTGNSSLGNQPGVSETNAGHSPLYGQQIIIGTNGVAPGSYPMLQLQQSFSDLARFLGQITGAQFGITNAVSTNLTGAIYLLCTNSSLVAATDCARLQGQGLEAFVIRGNASQLQIIANDVRGLSHGVCFYLEQLGVRWLLSGDNWTIVPTRHNVTLAIDRLVKPAFWARVYSGTGGFYSNLLGRQYTGSADRKKGISDFEIDIAAWNRRLRWGGQGLGHAMGEAFIADRTITPVLESHPEYLAKIDGKYTPLYNPAKNGHYVWNAATNHYVLAVPPGTGTHNLNVIAKLNAGNPGAVKLYCDWILKNFRASRNAPGGYAYQTMSVEPSDGGGEGNNYDELKAQGIGDGSESDQEFYIGNYCAREVRKEFPDVSVVLLAYATRSDPPTFALEPNFIVQPAMGLRGGRKTANLTMDEWLTVWAAKAKNMALYTYWSIPDWSHDEPTFNYLDMAKQLRDLYAKNIKGICAESTYSGGAMGLSQYVAAHLMWDINLDEHALIEEWYDKAFGPAKAPMKRMMERWAQNYRPLSAELGASYRDLDEAERLAAGDPAVIVRLDDYARYLHYLRLRNEFLSATDAAAKNQKASALAEYVFDINTSRMVHTIRAFDLLAFRGYKGLMDEFHLHNANDPKSPPDGPGWVRVHQLTHDEVVALITDGLRNYHAADFEMRKYTGRLVPLKPIVWSTPQGDPWGVTFGALADLDVDVTIPPELAKLPLRISRYTDNVVTVFDESQHAIFTHSVTGLVTGPGSVKLATWDEVNIPLAPGHYQVHFHPRGGRADGYFNVQTWRGVPFILGSFLGSKGLTAIPQLYFYVPQGLPKVVLYLPDTGDFGGALTPKLFDSNGVAVPVERQDNGKLLLATVPAGQDGKVWSCQRIVCPHVPLEMLTTPQTFSLSPEVLMVPAE